MVVTQQLNTAGANAQGATDGDGDELGHSGGSWLLQ
jgi:hypothetical protein